MSLRRKRHRYRTKHLASRRRKRMLFVGASAVMLIVVGILIVPGALAQNISLSSSIELALLLWVCCVFAVRTCLRARRKYRKSDDERHTSHHEFTASSSAPPIRKTDPAASDSQPDNAVR